MDLTQAFRMVVGSCLLVLGNARAVVTTIGVVIVLVGLVGYLMYERPRAICDDLIKATLKAPSTYQRVSVEGDSTSLTVEYEAQNSYGVPLRNRGVCILDDQGKAAWMPLSVGAR